MAIVPYLAMTAAEAANCQTLPEKFAWMACHFSPYGTGLRDLPERVPPGTLLILDDRIPPAGQDPQLISRQLLDALERHQCSRLLLDFQRTGCGYIVDGILESIPSAVVSEPYAGGRSCAVFLPPVPILRTPEEHLAPWAGREIWLEAAPELLELILTSGGSTQRPCKDDGPLPHYDEQLYCRYRTELSGDHARFILRRAPEDVSALLQEAERLGICNAVGLYQQLHP